MRRLRIVLVLVLVPVLLGLGVAYKNGTFDPPVAPVAGSPKWATRRPVEGVENFGEVSPGTLFRGAQPTAEGYQSLKKLGVKTIVSLRMLHSEKAAVTAAGLESVEIPLEADIRSVPPTPEQVAQFLAVVLDPAKQPVYFHCAHGKDRTGTMCAVFRMEVQGWTPDEAFHEMQSFGFNKIWENLHDFVLGYKPRGTWRAPIAAVASGN
jgi:protein tyrosine phosphatase (PTP) superfamily phosphohydrolase (DUF442 family)